jgi:hypothetical protein
VPEIDANTGFRVRRFNVVGQTVVVRGRVPGVGPGTVTVVLPERTS